MMRKPAFTPSSRGVQTGDVRTLPAPTGGWNTRDNEANMPATKATIMDNWFPRAADVILRPGCASFATDLPATVRSLFQYSGASGTAKFFAAHDLGITEITSGGSCPAVDQALTSGYVSTTMFANISGSHLFCVNGVDSALHYDGTSWSVPGITGVPLTSLAYVMAFKHRLWFLQADSMSAWYLGTNAIAGAAVEFPIGQLFNRGGHLTAMGSWTIDGGAGVDDYLVFASSEGELAVYKGSDPSDSTTFELVGVYYLGEPLGQRCLLKFGGDLLYLSQNGLFPLSKALLSTSINYRSALSDEIGPTFAEHSSLYKGNEGWEIFSYPQGSCILVNVPIAEGQRYDQFVMNTVNQAWCRFTGWKAAAFAIFRTDAYLSQDNTVLRAFSGTSDNGAQIVGKVKQAYTYLGAAGQQKHVTMLRPILRYDSIPVIEVAISADFSLLENWSFPTAAESVYATWDDSLWDFANWAPDLATIRTWYTVSSREGYCIAVLLRISSLNAKVIWNATDVLFQRGGVL